MGPTFTSLCPNDRAPLEETLQRRRVVATQCTIWPAWDLNFRPPAPETNALQLDQFKSAISYQTNLLIQPNVFTINQILSYVTDKFPKKNNREDLNKKTCFFVKVTCFLLVYILNVTQVNSDEKQSPFLKSLFVFLFQSITNFISQTSKTGSESSALSEVANVMTTMKSDSYQ